MLILLGAVLALTWLVYRPGLSGGFLFDDFVNLDALGRYGVVDNWAVFWRYVTSGTADPIGRPIALMSFLVDARSWPAEPAPFLRTNLLLHLLNGALLFALLKQLGGIIGDGVKASNAAALIGTGCWLLHPLFVSTTLYVVQREAMLPATFTLLGLIAYCSGRRRLGSPGANRGLVLASLGLGLGTLLAVLSKANGVLLPLLAGVLELCIFRFAAPGSASGTRLQRGFVATLILVPTFLVCVYLTGPLSRLHATPANRAWTLGERLLTEPRVVLDYLQLLAVPRSMSTGLFNDGYRISHSLLDPWTTLPAIVLVIALPLFALFLRRRFPALACAVLFYFAGHLLESTTLPLELYFEHRNYLPALLLFWPLGRVIASWNVRPALRAGVAVAILCVLGATTFQRSSLWGHPQRLAALWALSNPQSSRAQTSAAITASQAGRPDLALARLEPQWRARPYELQIALNVANARCASGGLVASDKQGLQVAFANTRVGALMMTSWLERAVEVAAAQQCRGMSLQDVESWIDAAQGNPNLGDARRKAQDLEPVRALLALHRNQPNPALIHFNAALAAYPTPDGAARNVVALASAGHYRQALAHLDYFEHLPKGAPKHPNGMSWLHEKVLDWQGYWPHEFAVLRSRLNEEIAKDADPATGGINGNGK